MAMSQAAAISSPPPMQWPWMAEMVGFGQSQNCMTKSKSASSTRRQSETLRSPAAADSLRSNPAEKARPSPEMTKQRIKGSRCNAVRIAVTSAIRTVLIAFRTCGRFSWIWAMPSSVISSRTVS
jgi:hypothetical protein